MKVERWSSERWVAMQGGEVGFYEPAQFLKFLHGRGNGECHSGVNQVNRINASVVP